MFYATLRCLNLGNETGFPPGRIRLCVRTHKRHRIVAGVGMSAAINAVLLETEHSVVVHKFGGSSLADPASMRQAAARLMEKSAAQMFVVVSAARGVTDDLLACIDAAARRGRWNDILAQIKRRQRQLVRDLLPAAEQNPLLDALAADLERLYTLAKTAAALGIATPEAYDLAAAHGELWSMRLFAALLSARDLPTTTLDARCFLRAARHNGEVRIDWDESAARFAAAAPTAPVVVVPGFIAARSLDSSTLTLGRNGSDWSATIVARLAGADSVTLWTDVPGVLEADPHVVPEARVHATLGLETARIAAERGARVLHPATLAPLSGLDIPLAVRDTFEPGARGTVITPTGRAGDTIIAASPQGETTTVSAVGTVIDIPDAIAALETARINYHRLETENGRISVSVAKVDAIQLQQLWHRALCHPI